VTPLARSQLREIVARLAKVQAVVDAFAKEDLDGALALQLIDRSDRALFVGVSSHGWKTAHVFAHYDLGSVDAVRERLTAARQQAARITQLGSRLQGVVPPAASTDCTATAEQQG
jgi:hypothetical protein